MIVTLPMERTFSRLSVLSRIDSITASPSGVPTIVALCPWTSILLDKFDEWGHVGVIEAPS